MKFLIVLSLLVAVASAGALPGHLPSFPLMPAVFLDKLESRITNGEVARLGQFPYQAALDLKKGKDKYFCGGTIIADNFVLTAAHCVDGVDSVVVTAGAINIKKNEKHQEKLAVAKEQITIHEGWNPSTLTNDIALIELPVRLHFNDYIQKAVLPKSGESFEGKPVVASGWGQDSDSSEVISPVLRFVDSTVISKSTCNRYYLGSTPKDTVCISGKNGKSTCNGDSGGPLVYVDNGKNIVIGATSFGIRFGCEKGWPGVFTATASYLEWINEVSGVGSD